MVAAKVAASVEKTHNSAPATAPLVRCDSALGGTISAAALAATGRRRCPGWRAARHRAEHECASDHHRR